MNYNLRIHNLKAKMIPNVNKLKGNMRLQSIIKNGQLKEQIQHLKNMSNQHTYKMKVKSNQIKLIEKHFGVNNLSELSKRVGSMYSNQAQAGAVIPATNLDCIRLGKGVIKYFHITHPDFSVGEIQDSVENNIDDILNS